MSRLIIIPQYPAKLRYQEWWLTEFPNQFKKYFDKVLVLSGNILNEGHTSRGHFAPISEAIAYELDIINQYMSLKLRQDDILLLNDLSFPGFFVNTLYHKRPEKCFAICHATSKNRYDYFMNVRSSKYPTEKASARLFNKIFVATKYHVKKLGWANTIVQALPFPPFESQEELKNKALVSVARMGKQKRTTTLEWLLEGRLKQSIQFPVCFTWEDYYTFLAESKILLISAKEETYGYQVVDAILNNCIPIAPNIASYPELLPRKYLYNTYEELEKLVKQILKQYMPKLTDKNTKKILVPKLKVQKQAEKFYENLSKHMKNE